jgi:hypothetical protein
MFNRRISVVGASLVCRVESTNVEQRQAEGGRRKFGDLSLLELLAEDELFDESDPRDFCLGLDCLRVALEQEAPLHHRTAETGQRAF